MGNDFFYAQPVKIWFGDGCFERLGEVLDELKVRRAVLVCGRHFAGEAQLLKEKLPAICAIFSEVEPNPQLSGVAETARLARDCQADAVIGIGGGSAMDTAKYAAAIAPGDAEAEQYYHGALPLPEKALSIICVPTTAGTGSEVTQVSVISNGTEKRTTNHPSFMPKAAVVDPLLTLSVSPYTTMITGLDAMAHALEGCWSRNHQPITDLLAAEAVRLILENLDTAYRDGAAKEARAALSYASLLAGLSFALPKTAGCHACSYPLSENWHLPHGEACAFTLDSFVRINADDRLETLCRKAGLSGTKALADQIRAFKQEAGLKTRLADLGEVDIPALASACAVHPLMQNNPVRMDEAALEKMFEALA